MIHPIWQELIAAVDAFAEVNDCHIVRAVLSNNQKTDFSKKFKHVCDRSREFRIKQVISPKYDINSANCKGPLAIIIANAAMALAEVKAENVDVANTQATPIKIQDSATTSRVEEPTTTDVCFYEESTERKSDH